MSDSCGQAHSLTVLTPIHPGREIALMARLNDLPLRAKSPFARVAHTHFARLLVIGDLVYEGPPQKRDHLSVPYLLFTSTFDGRPFGSPPYDEALAAYLEVLYDGLAGKADEIWGDCIGYPQGSGAQAFADYIAHNRVPTTFFVSFYPDATVEDVRTSMALRAQITQFAIEAQELSAGAKLAAFRERFAGSAAG